MKKIILTLATTGLFFSAVALAEGTSFSSLDANGDGAISKDEAASSEALAPLFTDADSNADGSLDKDEFSALVQPAPAPEEK